MTEDHRTPGVLTKDRGDAHSFDGVLGGVFGADKHVAPWVDDDKIWLGSLRELERSSSQTVLRRELEVAPYVTDLRENGTRLEALGARDSRDSPREFMLSVLAIDVPSLPRPLHLEGAQPPGSRY